MQSVMADSSKACVKPIAGDQFLEKEEAGNFIPCSVLARSTGSV